MICQYFPPRQTELEKHAFDATYFDVKLLIQHVVDKFRDRYGVFSDDRDDMISFANVVFCKCYHDCDLSRSKLESRVGFLVHNRLLDRMRKQHRRIRTTNSEETSLMEKVSPIMSELSKDAKRVLNIVTDTVGDFRKLFGRKGHGLVFRQCLDEALYENGWTEERIAETFEEIGDFVSDPA